MTPIKKNIPENSYSCFNVNSFCSRNLLLHTSALIATRVFYFEQSNRKWSYFPSCTWHRYIWSITTLPYSFCSWSEIASHPSSMKVKKRNTYLFKNLLYLFKNEALLNSVNNSSGRVNKHDGRGDTMCRCPFDAVLVLTRGSTHLQTAPPAIVALRK